MWPWWLLASAHAIPYPSGKVVGVVAEVTNASSVGDMEAVSVPYPATTPVTGGGNAATKFFRVTVE